MSKTFTMLAAATAIGASGGISRDVAAFELTSTDIQPNSTIGAKHVLNSMGCSGENVSPALAWNNAPAGTKSFALLVHDPDAPTGGAGWWHWLVYNIPAGVSALPQGAGKGDGSAMVKGAAQATTDFGSAGYGGPCPPAGDKPHHYNFTLHALKVDKLDIPKGASASVVGYNVNANTIAKAKLTGVYGRQK